MNLFVVGAGYVGLTTAAVFARLGHSVVVHDVDERRIVYAVDRLIGGLYVLELDV